MKTPQDKRFDIKPGWNTKYTDIELANKAVANPPKPKQETVDPVPVQCIVEDIARINDVFYQTIEDAIDNADDGDTITLLKDVTAADVIDPGEINITIDGQGHAFICNFGFTICADIIFQNITLIADNFDEEVIDLVIVESNSSFILDSAQMLVDGDGNRPEEGSVFRPYDGELLSVIIRNGSVLVVNGMNSPEGGSPVFRADTDYYGHKVEITDNSEVIVSNCNNAFAGYMDVSIEGSRFRSDCGADTKGGFCITDSSTVQIEGNELAAASLCIFDSAVSVSNSIATGISTMALYVKNSSLCITNATYSGIQASCILIGKGSSLLCKDNNLWGILIDSYYSNSCELRSLVIEPEVKVDIFNNRLTGIEMHSINDGILEIQSSDVRIIGNGFGNPNRIHEVYGGGIATSGELILADGVVVSNNYATYGGGISFFGKGIVSKGAAVFGNHATQAGDDFYVRSDKYNQKPGTLIIDSVNNAQALEYYSELKENFTGWYDDSKNSRWNANIANGNYHIVMVNPGMHKTGEKHPIALKAAHGLSKVSYEWVGNCNPPDVQIPGEQIVEFGAFHPVTQPPTAYSNWSFDGWYLDKGLTCAFNPEVGIQSEAVTLYGKWNKEARRISLTNKEPRKSNTPTNNFADNLAGNLTGNLASNLTGNLEDDLVSKDLNTGRVTPEVQVEPVPQEVFSFPATKQANAQRIIIEASRSNEYYTAVEVLSLATHAMSEASAHALKTLGKMILSKRR